jgi:RimJ/RimL family protein N-acetyltransferase
MLFHPLADGAVLSPLEPWQAADFAAHVERERAHLAPWLPWATRVVDEASARTFLQRYADSQAADGGRLYGIRLAGALAGGVLFRVFEPAYGTCEVGVWLAAGAQGRGLVTRAAAALIDWAFDERRMGRVEWRTLPDNARSIAAAKRLGMTREGVLRSAYPIGGARHDVEVWSVLPDEWRARRAHLAPAPRS